MADGPDIDIPIPSKEVPDLPVPPKTERVVPERIIEPTLVELIETTKIAAEISPEIPRQMLKYIQAGQKIEGTFEEEINKIRSEGELDPQQAALAIDLELGFILRQVGIVKKKLTYSLEKRQPNIELAQELETLIQRVQNLREQRNIGEPNEVAAFAKALGVDDTTAIINPLGGIEEKIIAAISDEVSRQRIISELDKMGISTKEIKSFLGDPTLQENVRKYGKKAAMAGGAVGLIMLLSGWFAMKMESGKRQ